MSLKVYNTLKREKEAFVPIKSGNTVGMYVCGVTVYDDCHLGHARAYVSFDIVRRYLEYKGCEIKHVQNFTDIDDKVIAKARTYKEELCRSEGKEITLKEAARFIAEKYTQEYFKYMDKLSIKRAALFPKATEHIPEMIELVETLIKKEYAYAAEGNVFFSIEKFPSYGKLSGRKLDEMKPGARVDVDERKRHPLDFVLWKKAKEDEPSWESPWGEGRPGWHIECSAMSIKYLGESFDIHGGGQDLIFPHHENEIAQSEGCTGKPFARYWLHNGFVTINREKMSKSLGNFFTLREILEKYDPLAVRLFLISTHYRHPIDFSDDELGKSVRKLERLKECDRKLRNLRAEIDSPTKKENSKFLKEFEGHMDNDFNAPGALGVIFDMTRHINTEIDKGRTKEADFAIVVEEFVKLREVLGLPVTDEAQHLQARWDEIDESKSLSDEETEKLLSLGENLADSEIEELIIQRELARRNGSWEKADKIRTELSKFLRIQDTSEGTVWKRQ
jgi:cysteinyl-tRNA synthetase